MKKLNQKALQTGLPKGTFRHRDPHPTTKGLFYCVWRTARGRSPEYWVPEHRLRKRKTIKLYQDKFQTNSPKGTFKRGDKHPTIKGLVFVNWQHGKLHDEKWNTKEYLDKKNTAQRERHAERMLTDPSFRQAMRKRNRQGERRRRANSMHIRIRDSICSRINKAVKAHNAPKTKRTLELLGCSIEFLKTWLSSQFKENMSWDNYGDWHIDHKKPCASFDLTDSKQQEECFRYTNLQPMWASDNQRKGNKTS